MMCTINNKAVFNYTPVRCLLFDFLVYSRLSELSIVLLELKLPFRGLSILSCISNMPRFCTLNLD